MVRPDMHDPALCEELRRALAELEASRIAPPAASKPEEINSLVPDPTNVDDAPADVAVEIERIRQELRRNGCEE